jgi:O-antigen biosynthesis protein
MRVAFLVAELGRSGGMHVIRDHARHMQDAGDECQLVVCAPKLEGLPTADSGIPVTTLATARDDRFDVAVATWWTTAEALFEVQAARHVVFVQNLEHRFYRDRERADALGALGVLDLPVDYLVVSSHLRRVLERLRPDARTRLVPVGIDKQRFSSPPSAKPAGPLRVLIEGQPTLWFKGVAESVAAARAMREPATLTVVAHDPADVPGGFADRVEAGLSPDGMAALYAEHDVLVKLARFEGLGLPPLEAFHAGVPCVLTPFSGSEDYARHGMNSLVVGFDDDVGASAALDLLARDPALRTRLSQGALETAAGWPDQAAASAQFRSALEGLVAEPASDAQDGHRRLLRGRRLAIELSREEERRDATRLRLSAAAVEGQRAEVERHLHTISELRARKSYRAARFVNRLIGRGWYE